MQHFKFVNLGICGFVFWCHEQVKSLYQAPNPEFEYVHPRIYVYYLFHRFKGSMAFMQHFKFVNWRIRGFVYWCHKQVKSLYQAPNPEFEYVHPRIYAY